MSFKEKYDEYKQRQEAKRFFNQNNDYHFETVDYVKTIVCGTLSVAFVSLILLVIQAQVGMNFAITYLILGYLSAYVVLKLLHFGSDRTGIVSVISYLIGLWLSGLLHIWLQFSQYAMSLPFSYLMKMSVSYWTNSSLFTIIFVIAGAIIAYSLGKD